jgi:hypothetical protein
MALRSGGVCIHIIDMILWMFRLRGLGARRATGFVIGKAVRLTLPRSQNIALSEVKLLSKLLLIAGKEAFGHKDE